jgi:signal transduction histidine kinase
VPGHFEQILDNLLANALDVTPAGKAIRLRIEPNGTHVSAHVEDQGPGMTAEERGRAFDRFWQGSTRTNGSSGLGLAIVQQLAHLNGADVTLNPSASGGLDAAVILERATPEGQPA